MFVCLFFVSCSVSPHKIPLISYVKEEAKLEILCLTMNQSYWSQSEVGTKGLACQTLTSYYRTPGSPLLHPESPKLDLSDAVYRPRKLSGASNCLAVQDLKLLLKAVK